MPRDPFDILDPFSSRTDPPNSFDTGHTNASAATTQPTDRLSQRDRLLREISTVYFDSPNAQRSLVEEFNELLEGVPAAVQIEVLKDLQADLTAPNTDSTPETTYRTGFEERVRWHWKPALTRRPSI